MFRDRSEIARMFKGKLASRKVTGYEVILTLITLVYEGKISYDEATLTLEEVYDNNMAEVVAQLDLASDLVMEGLAETLTN